MSFPYPDEATLIKAYQDRVRAEYNAVGRIFPDPNDSDAFRWFTRYGFSAREMPESEAASKHIRELHEALNPSIPGPTPDVKRPLVGALRIENKLFRDDTGYRRVLFCSWFPALRILRDNPTEFRRQLDRIVDAGYQGVRVFLAVGGWMGYWDNREVAPITYTKWYFTGNHLRTDQYGDVIQAWSNYDDLLRELCREFQSRGLRLHVTCGDLQIICPDGAKEIGLHKRFANILAEFPNLTSLYEVTNEYPLNRYGGNSDSSIQQMGRVIDAVRAILPNTLCAQGAGLSEEPPTLFDSSRHGQVCTQHTSRDPFSTCLKRTLGLVYWEGDYRFFSKPFWQGEPAGPGADSYQRQDNPANLVALYSMHALTGQASNWFQGAAVRSFVPLESEWGFELMPTILNIIPEDVATFNHGHNPGSIEYWWSGNKFYTSTLNEWDITPPRPIDKWTLYNGSGSISGIGTPPKSTGLLTGTFV